MTNPALRAATIKFCFFISGSPLFYSLHLTLLHAPDFCRKPHCMAQFGDSFSSILKRPTTRVTGGWEGRDSPSKRKKLKATKKLQKRGAYPPVHCTLCSAALMVRVESQSHSVISQLIAPPRS